MSWIISGMPGITWSRVKTWAPACMRSATVRPSRAPSTMKSEMIATASGWLSLTPRSSRRRATIAAIEIRSLSFSRGERFMRTLWLVEPQARQRRGAGAAEHRHHVGAQPRRILGTETRHCKAIPGGDADLAAKGICSLTDTLHDRLIARHDQGRGKGSAAFGDRRPRQFCADVAVEANGLGEDQPAAAAQAPAVDEFAPLHALAHGGAAEHDDFAEQKRGAFGKINIDPARDFGGVEQDGFLRQPGQTSAIGGLQRN